MSQTPSSSLLSKFSFPRMDIFFYNSLMYCRFRYFKIILLMILKLAIFSMMIMNLPISMYHLDYLIIGITCNLIVLFFSCFLVYFLFYEVGQKLYILRLAQQYECIDQFQMVQSFKEYKQCVSTSLYFNNQNKIEQLITKTDKCTVGYMEKMFGEVLEKRMQQECKISSFEYYFRNVLNSLWIIFAFMITVKLMVTKGFHEKVLIWTCILIVGCINQTGILLFSIFAYRKLSKLPKILIKVSKIGLAYAKMSKQILYRYIDIAVGKMSGRIESNPSLHIQQPLMNDIAKYCNADLNLNLKDKVENNTEKDDKKSEAK